MDNFSNNKKVKLIIAVIIFIIIVAVIAAFLFLYFQNKNNDEYSYIEQKAYDNSFSINIPDIFEFEKSENNSNYDLALYSEKYNSRILVSSFDSTRVRSILDVINSDKNDFISKFQGAKDITELNTDEISGMTSYEYNFTASGRFIQNYYIINQNKVYVFDFDIDVNSDYEYNLKDFIKEVVESFKL